MNSPDTWLQLLLADVSVDELDAHRRSLEPSAEVESEARRALQLQARLRDRSQRAASLAALSDIASRLTSTRDLAELLHDIAVHARQLLRTDVTYLALLEVDPDVEPGQRLRIRYFDGLLGGRAAREIRLSTTSGLAGRIIETGLASSTADYLSDTTISHESDSDAFAGEERLRSILGVPLRARGTVLGVLFAAERAVRPFSEDETSLLAGFAGHAAVAIENARLLEAERTAAAQVRAAHELLRRHSAATERAIVLHERLTQAAVRGGGPEAVVQSLSDVLGMPVQLLDARDRSLTGPDLGIAAPASLLPAGDQRTVILPGDDGGARILCPVVATDEYLGCLVALGAASSSEAEVRLLERGAAGIALALVQQRAITEAAARSRGELLTALVDGGDPEVLTRRAVGLEVDLSRRHVLVVVQADDAAGRAELAELVRRHDGLLAERSGRIVVLLPRGVDLEPLARSCTAAVSPPIQGARDVPGAYASARRCLQATLALGRCHLVATAGSLGLYGFLLSASGPQEASEFVERTVGRLLQHDEERSSALAPTLEEYLANGRQHNAAAASLHIHPNTLYQRLARISSVLGDDWRQPDQALDLLVALRLHRLAIAL